MMSEHIADMIKKAELDQSVVNGLTQSIKDFEASAKAGANNAGELAKINKEFAENANKLTSQMESLANNLESLNSVYVVDLLILRLLFRNLSHSDRCVHQKI